MSNEALAFTVLTADEGLDIETELDNALAKIDGLENAHFDLKNELADAQAEIDALRQYNAAQKAVIAELRQRAA